jgi:hypothetical protein
MAGVRNADISVLNYNFITADRLPGGNTATSSLAKNGSKHHT